MASGFERLEKFFSSSRKKDKGSRENAAASRTTRSTHISYSGSGTYETCLFPPPSFMKPTSTRMYARGPLYEKEEVEDQVVRDKGRSRSLPDVKKSFRSQSSTFNSLEIERKTRSYGSSRPPFTEEPPRTPVTPTSGFPEDVLFRSFETPCASANTSPRHIILDEASLETPKQEILEHNLLGWSPKHISLLFKPGDLPSMNEHLGLNLIDDAPESMILMPSPMFTPPLMPPPKSPLREKPSRCPPTPHHRLSSGIQNWGFSEFPKQYSVISSVTSGTYSPPLSDSEDECSTPISDHTGLASKRFTPTSFSADSSPKSIVKTRQTRFHSGYGKTFTRETWGARQDDPKHGRSKSKESPMPRSRFPKTQSTATLSTVNSKIRQEHILQEPTINDIYTLSDEDIFEARPFTPAPDLPPPVPPKDDLPARMRPRAQPYNTVQPQQPQRIYAVNPQSGELTPPETPIDSSFLIPMPTRHSAKAFGAIMAARIARKYNFDLIYLVSLWPSGAGAHLDPSLPRASQTPQQSPMTGGSIYAGPRSKLTGRYLAAFGLEQIQMGEPFQIEQKVLLKTLRSESWSEYDDANAPFSHGWTCSFNSDFVPLGQQSMDTNILKSAKNRGIVFAAYTRQHNEALIPKESTTRNEVLHRLRGDVECLLYNMAKQN
ncbi:hypothetical protein BKA67DRAFT_583900 [Truncatella angustata]|uniref:Uncharacterized protein n=1 Tax=Truncatella angustata TaxID=152316 RepID=A0A9P8RMV4_9PEZI|nr:uncharacterized protein BKA67DRAFT_583900 [Truncatella angustata]KAH6646335.1 hypothetical protein BKA67DRAFT_583900 [Truncatella angustata]KAH8201162.1 hypothetical protein TruAng_004712 [Truncatella angustata]